MCLASSHLPLSNLKSTWGLIRVVWQKLWWLHVFHQASALWLRASCWTRSIETKQNIFCCLLCWFPHWKIFPRKVVVQWEFTATSSGGEGARREVEGIKGELCTNWIVIDVFLLRRKKEGRGKEWSLRLRIQRMCQWEMRNLCLKMRNWHTKHIRRIWKILWIFMLFVGRARWDPERRRIRPHSFSVNIDIHLSLVSLFRPSLLLLLLRYERFILTDHFSSMLDGFQSAGFYCLPWKAFLLM